MAENFFHKLKMAAMIIDTLRTTQNSNQGWLAGNYSGAADGLPEKTLGMASENECQLRTPAEKSVASMSKELEKKNQQLYCVGKNLGCGWKTADDIYKSGDFVRVNAL